MKCLHLMAGLGQASGVANIARRFARVQRERGDEAVLLAPSFKWNPIFFGFRFLLRAWREARRADEIWVHCSWTFPVWFGAWLAKGSGRRKLVVVPEGSFDPKRMNNHAGWKKRFVAPLDRWVLRQADEVLALCPDEVAWVKAFEPTAKVRREQVPLFLRSSDDSRTDEARRRVSGVSRPMHVLFLGRAEDPLKGVRFLERAVDELRRAGSPLELRVVSDHFGEELERDWAWCDVFCLPTLSDNFGLVVAEALEHGKRVVVTDGASAWESFAGLTYLKGYREGTDDERVRLLKEALASHLGACEERTAPTVPERTVWIVNPFDNLPMEGNRPQRYWLMARAFVAAGWKVVYWTSDFSHATKEGRKVRGEGEGGIVVRMIPTLPYRKNVCFARIRSHLKLARDFERVATLDSQLSNPQLIIASTPPLGLCAAAMDVAKTCGATFVCDIQDAWPETFGRLLPRGFGWMGTLLFAGMRRTARRLYREADLVTGVSQRYAELTGRRDYYLAYLGIEKAKARGEGEGEGERLVYVGNLGSGYDLETVVLAVARRAELTLDIAGLGPREADLKHLVARLGLDERVRFHGYLGTEELGRLMASCDVGVIPMRDDSWVGLPNKLADYLAAGLRVVSSLHGECGALLQRTGYGATYELHAVDSLLVALDALKPVEVVLPEALRAERIYADYVQRVNGAHLPILKDSLRSDP